MRDPTRPKTVNYIENPPNTWSLHLQVHDDLLLLVHGRDMFSQPEMADERNYYKPKAGRHDDHATPQTRNWSAGMAVFDISEPAEPRQIGFMPVEGTGLHRIWYVGGRWAYASAMMEGFSDYILVTIDMADPTKPAIVGRYWLPGMNLAAGEVANWPLPAGRYGLHHAVVQDDMAYCAWRDACLVVVDVKDKSDPKLVVHKNWAPPFGGGTHNCLPLPDRPPHRARRGGARREAGRLQADLGVRQPGEIEPDQRGDFPRAERPRLYRGRRPLRPAQHP